MKTPMSFKVFSAFSVVMKSLTAVEVGVSSLGDSLDAESDSSAMLIDYVVPRRSNERNYW